MRILAADGLDKKAIAALEGAGHSVELASGLDQDALVARVSGIDVLVVRSATKVARAALEAGRGSLKLVIRAGSGLDSIDTAAAKELGIAVANTPGLNAAGVAELAIGLMFAVARKAGFAHWGMAEGRWEKKAAKGIELAGRRLGVVGLGEIGSRVAKLGTAIGMDVVGFRRTMIGKAGDPPLMPLPQMIETCDVISLHVPKSPETKNLVDASMLAHAKRGLIIINTARGDVLDLDACAKTLAEGRLGGLGLDVYPVEPAPANDLFRHPSVVALPHIGAQTEESTERIGKRVVELVRDLR